MSFSVLPPNPYVPNLYNENDYLVNNISLSVSTADQRYLKLTGGSLSGLLACDSGLAVSGTLTLNGIVITSTGTEINYLSGLTIGTASPSKALVLDASKNIIDINNISIVGNLTSNSASGVISIQGLNQYLELTGSNNYIRISNTVASTSSTTGAIRTGGGIYIGNHSIFNGDLAVNGILTTPNISVTGAISQTIAAGGDFISLNSTSSTTRNTIKFVTNISTMEFGSRSGSAGSFPNTMYMYTNGSYKWIMNASSGDTQILSTTDTTAINTGCLQLSGGLSVVKNVYTTGQVTIDRSGGSNFNLKNGSNFAFLEVASTNMLRLVAGTGGSIAMNLDSNGLFIGGGTSSARSIIDMGATATNKSIALFNNSSSYYGISPNNSSLQYSSFNQHNWYSSCTDSNPINFNSMSLTSGGSLTTAQNVIAGTGIWCKQAFSSVGRSGIGAALVMGNSTYAECYAYDYGTSQYKPIYIGNVMYVNNGSQSVNIGGGINPGLYPLTVNGSSSTTFSPYGYLSNSSYGTGGSSGVVPVSIWASARIACTEFNAYSDMRLKENINNININDALEFVKKINPKIYNWKVDKKNISIGYIAQDILRLRNEKWDNLVSLSEDSELEEIIDDDGFINPKGKRFQVNYSGAIPILHQALKHCLDEIIDLREKVNKNSNKVINNNKLIFDLKEIVDNSIIDHQKQINDIISHLNDEEVEEDEEEETTATAPIAIEYLESIKK